MRKVIRGASTIAAARVLVLLVQIAGDIVLAWMLEPSHFGEFLKVYVIAGFVMQFKDLGLSAATIQSQSMTDQEASNLHWINVAAGLVLMVIFLLSSPLIGLFYGAKTFAVYCVAMSPVFLISSLAIQRQAQFIRNQRFGIVAWASVASTLFSYIVAIVLAYLGLGIWSLILSLLARNAASTAIVILASSWIPCKYKKEPSTGRHLRFGSDVFKFDVINYLSRNIDNVVIGKFYGDQWLGIYSRAYQAMLFPIIQCRGPIVSAGMPALSKVSGDTSDHWESFMWIVRTVASLCIPLAASIYLFKYELINSILGPKWVDSALIIGYLTPAAVVQATGGLLGLYLLSLGKSSKYLTWGAGYSAVTVISILVGAVFGTNEVAKAYSIGQLILFFPSIWFCFEGDRRKMKQFTAASVWPILSCILAAIASKMCFINVADRLGVRISLIAGMSVFVVVYGALYIANEKRLRCLL